MKFKRRSFPSRPQAFRRRNSRNGRASVQCKCPACGHIIDGRMDLSHGQGSTAVSFSSLGSGTSIAEKRSSDAMDHERLLHFSQQLYAHALTLQEVIRERGGVTYEVLRPKCDRQAAQQFEVFYHL